MTAQVDFELVHSHDVMLNFWEPFWLTSTSFLIWGTLFGATRIITTETETAELAFRLIEKYKVSFMFDVVPFLIEMLQSKAIDQHDLTSLRNYFCVGSRPPPGMLTKLNKYFPAGQTHNSIGMTEMAGSYAASCANYGDDGAAGQLANGVEAKIIDVNGNRCGPNEKGELYLKPCYRLLGYYNNPEATEQAFDAEGFLMTGDIGYFDASNTNLYVVDRKKDIIRYNFHQISPSEIEAVLMRSPEIARVCVAGVPDAVAIDLPAAAIIRKKGSSITEKEVYDMIAGISVWFLNIATKYFTLDSIVLQTICQINTNCAAAFTLWTPFQQRLVGRFFAEKLEMNFYGQIEITNYYIIDCDLIADNYTLLTECGDLQMYFHRK